MDISELKPNILDNLDRFVKDEMAISNIPTDAKFALIDTVDLQGNKITVSVKIADDNAKRISLLGVWKHDWDGDDTVAAKLVFVRK